MLDYRTLFETLQRPPTRTVQPWTDRHPDWHRIQGVLVGDFSPGLSDMVRDLPVALHLAAAVMAVELALDPRFEPGGHEDDCAWAREAARLARELLAGHAIHRGIADLRSTVIGARRRREPWREFRSGIWLKAADALLDLSHRIVRRRPVTEAGLGQVVATVGTAATAAGSETAPVATTERWIAQWVARVLARFAVRTPDAIESPLA